MATSCPIGLDVDQLRREIGFIYDRVAQDPSGDFHFHRGPAYAAELLGYDASELAAIPATSSASFAGVGNPHCVAPIVAGETVVDIGCGAGTDLLLAAAKVGATGRAIGVDMTPAMAERARAGARAMGLAHVRDLERRDQPHPRQGPRLRRGVPDPQAGWALPARRHHRRERAVGEDPQRHRSVDRLNCRRSAVRRANRGHAACRFRRCRDCRASRPIPRDVEGEHRAQVRGRGREPDRPPAVGDTVQG